MTEQKLSQVLVENEVFRLDSVYYGRQYLQQMDALQKHGCRSLNTLAYVTDGIHESIPFSEHGNVKIISAKHPKENYFDLSETECVLQEYHLKNPRTALRSGDVILSTVGTIGNCAVVEREMLPANADRHVGIIRPRPGISPFYLSAFLLSKYGRFQTERETTGNVQPNLFISKISNLKIATASPAFISQVEQIVIDAYKVRKKSSVLYNEAECTLLSELGLLNWQPPEPQTYQRKSSVAFAAGRLDAEHFVPKYDALLSRVRAAGHSLIPLGEMVLPICNGFDYRDFTEEGSPYIRVGDIKRGRIDLEGAERVPVKIADVGKDVVLQAGDVLFTRKGSFGNSAVVEAAHLNAIISSEIMRLRLNQKGREAVLPEFLSLYLNGLAGYMQVEKWVHGAAFYSISQEDLTKVEIAILPMKKQRMLADLLGQSKQREAAARALLDRARRAVEIAIEEGEAAGMAFLKSEGGGA